MYWYSVLVNLEGRHSWWHSTLLLVDEIISIDNNVSVIDWLLHVSVVGTFSVYMWHILLSI